MLHQCWWPVTVPEATAPPAYQRGGSWEKRTVLPLSLRGQAAEVGPQESSGRGIGAALPPAQVPSHQLTVAWNKHLERIQTDHRTASRPATGGRPRDQDESDPGLPSASTECHPEGGQPRGSPTTGRSAEDVRGEGKHKHGPQRPSRPGLGGAPPGSGHLTRGETGRDGCPGSGCRGRTGEHPAHGGGTARAERGRAPGQVTEGRRASRGGGASSPADPTPLARGSGSVKEGARR